MGGGVAIAAIFICLWAPVVAPRRARRAARRPRRDPRAARRRLGRSGRDRRRARLRRLGGGALYVLAALLGVGIAVAQVVGVRPRARGRGSTVAAERERDGRDGTRDRVHRRPAVRQPAGRRRRGRLRRCSSTRPRSSWSGSPGSASPSGVPCHSGRTASGAARATAISFLLADPTVALMVVVVFVSLLFMSASIPRGPRLHRGRARRRGHRDRHRRQRLDARDAHRLERRRAPHRRSVRSRPPACVGVDGSGAREVHRAVLARLRVHGRDVRRRRRRPRDQERRLAYA